MRFGAREYDARVGRWVSRDPALFGGGDSNLYRYCGGEPVNFIDVDGRFPVVAVIAIGGAAVWIGWDLGAHLSPYIFASDRVNTSRANAIMNDATVVAAAAGENTPAGIHRVLYSWRSSQEAAHRPYRACNVPLSGPDDIDVVAAEHRATYRVLRDEYTPLGAFGFTAVYDITKFLLGPLPYLPFVGSTVTGRVSSDDRPPTPYNAFVTHYATN